MQTAEDLAGTALARAPKLSGFLTANIHGSIGDYQAHLDAASNFTSRYYFNPGGGGNLRRDFQPAYAVVNLSGGIGPQDGSVEIGFYVNNLTGKKYYAIRQTVAPFGAYDAAASPRTYGVRATMAF